MARDIIVVAGAGGFIGGWVVKHFVEKGAHVIAVDKKPLADWEQITEGAGNLRLDLSIADNCRKAVKYAKEVYNLAADMGGMGFISSHRVDCLRNVLINTNLIEAAYLAGVDRYFFASSACVYNTDLQKNADDRPLAETDAFPAMCERGYGWEKLLSEMVCQEYWHEKKLKTFVARFHNVYGEWGTYKGGKEKVIAAFCRKVIDAINSGSNEVEIWGDGTQRRSFMYIEDCVKGIDMITHCDNLIATPINLGTSKTVSINELMSLIEGFSGVDLLRHYDVSKPQGVAGRASDNTMIKSYLGWEPHLDLAYGLERTYKWIESQYVYRPE